LGGQIDALLIGVVAGATFLLVQRFSHEIKLGQAISKSDESSTIQGQHNDADASYETKTSLESLPSPNEVLAELERQESS
jgi:hypothetical protein